VSDIRTIIERALSGTLIQPTVTTSFAEMSDPKRRRNMSKLLGVTAVTPKEPPKAGDDSPAPTPAAGADQSGGGSE
jgi:hypothetical protein